MTTIPSFRASLVQEAVSNNGTPSSNPSSEELLNSPGQFEEQPQPEKHGWGLGTKIVTGAVALAALGFAGRQGWLSKPVQRLLGGTPKLSAAQMEEKVTAKLNEFMQRTEDTAFELKILGNGKTRASRIKANGNKEIITFDKNTGIPDFRVEFGNQKGNKYHSYTSWKGSDILEDGFDVENSFFKKFNCGDVSRKHGFGAKHKTTHVEYGEFVRGGAKESVVVDTTYYRDGSVKSINRKNLTTGESQVKDFLYDAEGHHRGMDIVESDGTIIRYVNGAMPSIVSTPNRQTSRWQSVLDFFNIQKRNVI